MIRHEYQTWQDEIAGRSSKFLTKAQVVLIIIVALGALASVGVAVGGF